MSDNYTGLENINNADFSSNLLETQTSLSENDLEFHEIDDLINKAGGFGKMQYMILIFALLASQGLNYFVYSLAYLELVPSVLCKYSINDDYVECTNYQDICN